MNGEGFAQIPVFSDDDDDDNNNVNGNNSSINKQQQQQQQSRGQMKEADDKISQWTSWTSEKLSTISTLTQDFLLTQQQNEQKNDDRDDGKNHKYPSVRENEQNAAVVVVGSPVSEFNQVSFTSTRLPNNGSAQSLLVNNTNNDGYLNFAKELESELAGLLQRISEGTLKLHEINPFDVKNHMLQDLLSQVLGRGT